MDENVPSLVHCLLGTLSILSHLKEAASWSSTLYGPLSQPSSVESSPQLNLEFEH